MAIRFAGNNQVTEAAESPPSRQWRPRLKKVMYPTFNNPSFEYGNPNGRLLSIPRRKRLTFKKQVTTATAGDLNRVVSKLHLLVIRKI